MNILKIAAATAMLAVSATPVAFAQTANPRVFSPGDREPDAPPVDVWLDQVKYDAGATIRPHFQTAPGAYVTIVRVTTDGELRVMYPGRPGRQARELYRPASDTRVPYSGYPGFSISESGGTGFIFAIASYARFDYSYFRYGDQWDNSRLASAGRYGDPFEIMRMFVDQTLADDADFSMDYATYEVFSHNRRSRYATRYSFTSFDNYYDRCYDAFGYDYSGYCRNYGYYNGFYGVIVGVSPRPPARTTSREPTLKPLVPDPMLPHQDVPRGPFITRDDGARNGGDEAALYSRRERMLRDVAPRIEMKTGGMVQGPSPESRAMERHRVEPRSEPRTDPRVYRDPVMRSHPESEPVRAAPRVQPQAPARVEVRNEPRVERIQRSEPRTAPAPIERDGKQ